MEEIEKPRKLSEEEIQDILSVVPDIKSVAHEVSVGNTKSLKTLLREQLQDIQITPIGIPDLKSEINRQFNDSVIKAGTMIGFTTSEALGCRTTQSALNSFHASGSAKNVSYGVERISELINASKEPKKPSCTIYFKDQFLSFDDVIIKKRPEITEITLKNLVNGIPDVESIDKFVEPYWYNFFRTLIRKDFKGSYVLTLNLDVNALYAYKLTMEDVSSAIELSNAVVCVYSPISEGRIDIYPIEKLIGNEMTKRNIISGENSSLIFLSTVVMSNLDKIIISGVNGIKQIYPVESPVWQIVKEEQKDKTDLWFLILNPVRMRITGIGVDKLVKLCEVAGMTVLKIKPNYIAVKSLESPSKIVREAIEKDQKEEGEYNKRRKEENLPPREASPISIYSKLVYADSTGSNFSQLLSNPDIDTTRTFCNNMHEIKEMLGIEAARSFIIMEFINVFGVDGYINPRHIVLLADYMTSLGKVYGVTFTGVSRQPIGALEKSSFEKAMDVFKEASGFGEQKTVSGTSASIFIGKKALVGTGYSRDYIKPENLERYNQTRKELLEDPNMVLDANAFNDAIGEINLEGDASMFMENLEEMFAPLPKESVEQQSMISSTPVAAPFILKGEMTASLELQEAVVELEEEMFKQVTCVREEKPQITVTSGEKQRLIPMPLPGAPKPKPQGVKIFSLDEFMG